MNVNHSATNFNVLRVLRVTLNTHIPKNSTHADNYTPNSNYSQSQWITCG